ncbi:MAG: DUF4391 domain-containing protein [Bifidobacterium tibiigranuli]|jgi:hypothetical protein|uniref:DUF4391 domain-containing protein n=1 Tax=Bifidobacterium tibiigranuli TaxID=2172043 RepID=UPI002357AD49|nr:DUF4391 domain-containing protein [Bifidobacterium tibiigranuli]MCH3973602.1 DUF4391 domain-containing protein [Bifidobacterium tibiigranuli]MCH4189740.1 DUF4391 domain-containing protein [Bifidobacterium tibiigranuli]MCH4204653.1 DUF4391 domain-containing protein [Bifidobacterium tibiigranuli]MCH4275437.1 DUF4391 domain-containing protein [Bifidobacterium tibiigranuli]MCI1797605.1 DUF4391 domain-containing protein [Bifidobacterium tibiigranuli]
MTLGLPSTSAVSAERARLTKESFYSHTAMSTSVRRHFVDDVDTFTMLEVLREAETGVAAGQHVHEIDVLSLDQSGARIPSEVMEHIARARDARSAQMGRMLFVCVHDSNVALAVYRNANMKEGLAESHLYIADQLALSMHGLRLAGTNLDEVWDSICSQVILDTW